MSTSHATVDVRGRDYTVEPVPTPGDVVCTKLISPQGKVYHVSRLSYGLECTCASFIYKKDGRTADGCKHIQALVAAGVMDAAPVRPERTGPERLTLLQWVYAQQEWYRGHVGETDPTGVWEALADSVDTLVETIRRHGCTTTGDVYQQDELLGATVHPEPPQTEAGVVILDEVHRYKDMDSWLGDLMADWLTDLMHEVDRRGLADYLRHIHQLRSHR